MALVSRSFLCAKIGCRSDFVLCFRGEGVVANKMCAALKPICRYVGAHSLNSAAENGVFWLRFA